MSGSSSFSHQVLLGLIFSSWSKIYQVLLHLAIILYHNSKLGWNRYTHQPEFQPKCRTSNAPCRLWSQASMCAHTSSFFYLWKLDLLVLSPFGHYLNNQIICTIVAIWKVIEHTAQLPRCNIVNGRFVASMAYGLSYRAIANLYLHSGYQEHPRRHKCTVSTNSNLRVGCTAQHGLFASINSCNCALVSSWIQWCVQR